MEKPPNGCHVTNRSEPRPGYPYLVEDFLYAEVIPTPNGPRPSHNIRRLVTSATAIQRVLEKNGSPFRAIEVQELNDLKKTAEMVPELLDRLEDLKRENAELKANQRGDDIRRSITEMQAKIDQMTAAAQTKKPGRPRKNDGAAS